MTQASTLEEPARQGSVDGSNALAVPRTLVVNFNSPELNELALALAQSSRLAAYVRTYVNKGRLWERVLAKLPFAGSAYASTFGRRRIGDASLIALTREAGVAGDVGQAVMHRLRGIAEPYRRRWADALQESVRHSVAQRAARFVGEAECVVAYVGFGLPAFESLRSKRSGLAVLNYPIAHHRQHRLEQRNEAEREPAFACTWPAFDAWPPGYEAQVDEEIRVADVVLVGSAYVRDTFEAQGVDPAKIAVVPYGVDLDVFTSRDASPQQAGARGFEVIFAGQLGQRKGIAYLLRGYRKFRRADSRLTLVGSYSGSAQPFEPYRVLYRHVAHQTRSALAQMYRESDVFVFPTLLEGMPLVVLEAMACGLPVIVTANGPGDLVRDGIDGYVIPCRDEDAICDRLERLYRDRELRLAMGRSARARALQFGWQHYAQRAQRVLASTAGRVALSGSPGSR